MSATSLGDLFYSCVSARRCDDWREFVRRFGPRVRAKLRNCLRRAGLSTAAEDLEELLQEFYYRLLLVGSRQEFEVRERCEVEVWAYLSRVAEALVVDHGRAHRPGSRRWSVMGDRETSPEERMLEKERRHRFLHLCRPAACGERGRLELEALRLALLEGWTSPEIARALGGFPAHRVDHLVHRLRRKLRAELGVELPRRGASAARL